MKKYWKTLIYLFTGVLSFTSCLGDEEETELTSTVAILSFSVNDLERSYTTTATTGEDSTATAKVTGSNYAFTIDHANRRIYNTDSLPYRTKINQATVNLSADGYIYYEKEGEKVGFNSEDSLDFTNPIPFTIKSLDERYTRTYLIQINVHQQDPEVSTWTAVSDANFQPYFFEKQKALLRGETIYLFGPKKEVGTLYMTSATLDEANSWTTPVPLRGLAGKPDYTSLRLFNQTFCMLSEGQLYQSEDGINWSATGAANRFTHLLSVTAEQTPILWAISEGRLAYSTNLLQWNTSGQSAEGMPAGNLWTFSYELKTHPGINRSLVIGTLENTNDTCAHVWNKLSTEANWYEQEIAADNSYGCPALENLTILRYGADLYAFGGKSLNNRLVPIEAFSTFFTSKDNGITWRVREDGLMLPDEFKGATTGFSALTDPQNRVWIFWNEPVGSAGNSSCIWVGRWNNL